MTMPQILTVILLLAAFLLCIASMINPPRAPIGIAVLLLIVERLVAVFGPRV